MKVNFHGLQKDLNSLSGILSNEEGIKLILICGLFLLELFLHILLFAHLLMFSGISSIILAFLFASICGITSFGIWRKHNWSLVPLLYIKWFKNNEILMAYINES